jgi:hypothetical protein
MNHEFCEERSEENTGSKRCSSGYQGSKEVDRVGGGVPRRGMPGVCSVLHDALERSGDYVP